MFEIELYGVEAKNGEPIVSSTNVAKYFEREHTTVLESIRELHCSEEFSLRNFLPRNRKVRGRDYPEYIMTFDGFIFLAMGYTGEKAAKIKEAYIKAFNYMVEKIKARKYAKVSFRPMTDAIAQAHTDVKHYHFTNEINMIYRIVLGFDAKSFREENSLDEETEIRDYIDKQTLHIIDQLQAINTGLILIDMEYQERKQRLSDIFSTKYRKMLP